MKNILIINNNDIATDGKSVTGKRSNSRIPRNVPAGYDQCSSRVIPVNLLSARALRVTDEMGRTKTHRLNSSTKLIYLELLYLFYSPSVTGGHKPEEVVISDADLAAKLGFGYQVVSAAVDMLYSVGLLKMTFETEFIGAKRVERKHSVRYTDVIDIIGLFNPTQSKKYKLV
ncbi:hypothetical protein BF128_004812 [Escherichia coli]|nr:hypothetical protein [Escherichia coli]